MSSRCVILYEGTYATFLKVFEWTEKEKEVRRVKNDIILIFTTVKDFNFQASYKIIFFKYQLQTYSLIGAIFDEWFEIYFRLKYLKKQLNNNI